MQKLRLLTTQAARKRLLPAWTGCLWLGLRTTSTFVFACGTSEKHKRVSSWPGPCSTGHHVQDAAAHLANVQRSSPQDFAGYLEFLHFVLPDRPCRPQQSCSCCYVTPGHASVSRSAENTGLPIKAQASHSCPCANLSSSLNSAVI